MAADSGNVNSSMWSFTPSLAASILFIILFLLTILIHLAQAIHHRKPYCIIIICSGLAQTLTYIFRTLSIKNPDSRANYEAWFVLILVVMKRTSIARTRCPCWLHLCSSMSCIPGASWPARGAIYLRSRTETSARATAEFEYFHGECGLEFVQGQASRL